MSVVLLDPRFPAMIPIDAVKILGDDVSYTVEVPVRVRWAVADLGGHTTEDADVLVTTNLNDRDAQARLADGEELIKSPSLLIETAGDRGLEASSTETPSQQAQSEQDEDSAGEVVEGFVVDILNDDNLDYAQAAQALHSQKRDETSYSPSTIQAIEDALTVVDRAYEQGAWEKAQTHESLLQYLREETMELEAMLDSFEPGDDQLEKELRSELSDIFLQVIFQAEISRRRGAFDLGDVAAEFVAKMYRRAPYIFDEDARHVDLQEQEELWAQAKATEQRDRLDRLKDIDPELAQFSGKQAVKEQVDSEAAQSQDTDSSGEASVGRITVPTGTEGDVHSDPDLTGGTGLQEPATEAHSSAYGSKKVDSPGQVTDNQQEAIEPISTQSKKRRFFRRSK